MTIGVLALAAVFSPPASAAPLGKDECEAMKSEQSALVAKGVRADMERGPGWAKSNLSGDRMKLVARLIEVDEQVLFRCATRPSGIAEEQVGNAGQGEAKPAAAAASPEKPAEVAPAAAEAQKPKRQAQRKKGEPAEKPAPAKAATAPAAADSAAERPEAAVAEPKRPRTAGKPKPKSSDVYTPPAGEPQSVLTAPVGVTPATPKAE